MIPKLYEKDITSSAQTLTCYLPDALLCEVTEERNGVFELYLRYPVTGLNYAELQRERIIQAKPNQEMDAQFFRIYRMTKPLDGIVSVYAQHISYDLCNLALLPSEKREMSTGNALNTVLANTQYTAYTDYSEVKPFGIARPAAIRSILGGTDGSILSLWHGEYKFDNFRVYFYQHRGTDRGVTIEYGKNLTSLEQEEDNTEVYTELLPYAVSSTEEGDTVVTLPEVTLSVTNTEMTRRKTYILDLSSAFESETEVTQDALRAAARSYLNEHALGTVLPSLTISFEPHTQERAVLDRVNLCDTVTVKHRLLGVEAKAKVIGTVYDALLERYKQITVGSAKSSMVTTMNDRIESAVQKAQQSKTDHFSALLTSAIDKATKLITGQSGGYVVIHSDDAGQPYEILILDQPEIDDAEHVWRWNQGGLGYSSTGYSGTYTTAITADGEIVADFMTSGTLTANIIRAGIVSSGDGSSWWDLESGEVHLQSYVTSDEIESMTESIEGVQERVSNNTRKIQNLEIGAEGLDSYVASLTERIETVDGEMDDQTARLLSAEAHISELEQTMNAVTARFTDQYIGGINYVRNSAGLNGLSDDWEYAGTVTTSQLADTKNNTVSESCFVLGSYSALQQTVDEIVPGLTYRLTLKAKKNYDSYAAYAMVTYNGNVSKLLFYDTSAFDWQEFSVELTDVVDTTVKIYFYSRSASLYVSDVMLSEGSVLRKWTPAPNEIYTTEVKIDRRGIEVSNSESSQRTVITNTEFAGYYEDEVVFTLNKDETKTKKTTVDGELTVGNTKFVPMENPSDGLNIVILD